MYKFRPDIGVTHEAFKEITTGILTTAVESGWGDWFSYKPIRDPDTLWVQQTAVLDVELGTIHNVTQNDIWNAMEKLFTVTGYDVIKRDVLQCIVEGDAAQLDAEGADVILQLAVLHAIVYA